MCDVDQLEPDDQDNAYTCPICGNEGVMVRSGDKWVLRCEDCDERIFKSGE